jgi:RNA polymerase sigma factor (sigma-70 family)
MTLFINGAKKKNRIEYPDWKSQEFLTLEEYLTIAKKVVRYHGDRIRPGLAKEILKNEDVLSSIAYGMMMADWRYKPDEGMTRYNYRNTCAKYCIHQYLKFKAQQVTRKFNVTFESLSKCYEDNEKYITIEDTKQITPLAKLIQKEEVSGDKRMLKLCSCLLDGTLTRNESKSIEHYYLDNMTYQEIGNVFGVSKQRVEQLVKSGLTKVRKRLGVTNESSAR